MTEPGGVGTPGTEAGCRLLHDPGSFKFDTQRAILAIEAEATRVERERVVRAVEGLEERNAYEEVLDGNSEVRRSEVLAIVDPS